MRSKLRHKLNRFRRIAWLHALNFSGDVFMQHLIGWDRLHQSSGLTEAGNANQHITVVAFDERRIDAQFACRHFWLPVENRNFVNNPSHMWNWCDYIPAAGECLPRILKTFNGEVAEVGLEQLLLVIAELHVEVAMKCAWLIFFRRFYQLIDALVREKDIKHVKWKQQLSDALTRNTLYVGSLNNHLSVSL